jgi:hypothetical protein
VREIWRDVSPLPVLFFAIGLAVAGWRARGRRWQDSLLLALWTLAPFLLLSLQEVKFARYLFIWLMPICALYVGVGIVAVGSALRRAAPHGLVEALLLILVVLGPRWSRAGDYEPWRFQLGLVDYVERSLLDGPVDNWQRIGWQADFLRQHVQQDDIVVTSFDDACLGFYLDRFVYGFLNSRRTDAFFVGLLSQAKRTHATVWLIDTLPELELCYEGDEAERSVDCRIKYARFYRSCVDPAASGAPCKIVVP